MWCGSWRGVGSRQPLRDQSGVFHELQPQRRLKTADTARLLAEDGFCRLQLLRPALGPKVDGLGRSLGNVLRLPRASINAASLAVCRSRHDLPIVAMEDGANEEVQAHDAAYLHIILHAGR